MTIPMFAAGDIELGPEPDRDAWCSPPPLRDSSLRRRSGRAPMLRRRCRSARGSGTVWCNWPWSSPAPWTQACREEARDGGALWVIGCGIADPSVGWFVDVWEANAVCFPGHRVQFMPPPGAAASSNSHPIAIPFWCSYSHPQRREWLDKFERAYEPLGKVIRFR